MAVFDLWCKLKNLPMYTFLGLRSDSLSHQHTFRKGYYTAAMNPDISHVISVIRAEAGSTTKYLKIKVSK